MVPAIRLDEWLCQQFDLELPLYRRLRRLHVLRLLTAANGHPAPSAGRAKPSNAAAATASGASRSDEL